MLFDKQVKIIIINKLAVTLFYNNLTIIFFDMKVSIVNKSTVVSNLNSIEYMRHCIYVNYTLYFESTSNYIKFIDLIDESSGSTKYRLCKSDNNPFL
ncbi:putative ORFan [Cotonvirus japonicus]|uniref:ORFan n=1 Tax=Cotonvirus japonicus TaxID=2811091 RepID=A0ABM7NRT2_9VIRU|nr:putative ORFan [Cotonvirus japonicus]BCS82861.1 putative ORFan [Cotonvirus japonicus]